MDSMDIASAIRDALEAQQDFTPDTVPDEDAEEEIVDVMDDFSSLWITTSKNQTFHVKVQRVED